MTCWRSQQQEIDLTVQASDEFLLYDLRVEVIAGDKPMVCNHAIGDYFELSGENLTIQSGQAFPL